MRSDQHTPIAGDLYPALRASSNRFTRSVFVVILGFLLLAVMAAAVVDTGGVNLETETASEEGETAVAATDPSSGTLIVQSPEGSSPEMLSDDSGDAVDETTQSEHDGKTDPDDPATSIGEAESASAQTADPTDSTGATSVSDASAEESTPTTAASVDSSGRTTSRSATTGSDTSTTRRSTTAQPSSTTQQSTTTQRSTTTQQSTTTTAASSGSGPVYGVGRASQPGGSVLHVRKGAAGGGDGSESRPFNSINDGILAVRAGETLMIHGGEYRERITPGSRLPDGTSSKPILVTNAPGERVVLKGYIRLTGLTHFTVDGINVTWDSTLSAGEAHMVLLKGGNNWEWRNSEFWGARAASAVLVGDSPRNWALRGNYVHDTRPTNDVNQDHLIYCSCGSGGGVIERNLLVGSPNGRAIKVGTTKSSDPHIENVTIRYNTMVDNRGPSNLQVSYKVANITIERNLMVSPRSGKHNVTAYRLEGASNIAVGNNLGWDSTGVVESHSAIRDTGGNRSLNPRLDSRFRPQDSAATGYGHLAP